MLLSLAEKPFRSFVSHRSFRLAADYCTFETILSMRPALQSITGVEVQVLQDALQSGGASALFLLAISVRYTLFCATGPCVQAKQRAFLDSPVAANLVHTFAQNESFNPPK